MQSRPISSIFMFGAVGFALVIVFIGAVSLYSTTRLGQTGRHVGQALAPLGDAAMEIKLTATQAHLLFEEIMSGDEGEDIDEVWRLLEESRFYVTAILDGGSNDEGTFLATDIPEVREIITEVGVSLDDFAALARTRYASLGEGQGVGSDADAEFDALYDDLVARIARIAAAQELAADAAVQAAAGEARYALAHGHLLVAEILGGDDGEDFGEATGSFAAALAALDALPGSDALGAVRADIARLIELAEQRYARAGSVQAAGSGADEAFDQAFEGFIARADAAEEIVHDAMAEGLATIEQTQFLSMLVPLVGVLSLITAGVLAYSYLKRALADRLQDLAGVVEALSRGDLQVAVPDWRACSEIGTLRDNIERYRATLVEQADQREKAETDERAQAARNAERTRLSSELGAALGQVQAGNLSVRLNTEFDTTEVADLARRVNALIEHVGGVVHETQATMNRLADADLTSRFEGAFEGAFADLQRNVNATVNVLRDLVASIQHESANLADVTGSLSGASETLSRQASIQASSLEETSATLEEMMVSIRTISDSAAKAKDLSQEATAQVASGGEITRAAIEAMGRIEENSHQITEIVTVIDGISFQTNLLALNAAVEAARAGEAGKGFAVVASEVRTLAQRSSEAAGKIRDLITSAGAQVAEGVQLVEETGRALDGIAGAISTVNDTVVDISGAVASQASNAESIASATRNLDRDTRENARLATEGAGYARKLSQSATSLEKLVGGFVLTGAADGGRDRVREAS